MIWLLFILTTSQLLGQSKYPADSLLNSSNISIFRKTALVPIMAWQRLSYNSKLFNCQFDPSCSNYGAVAIKQHGLIIGGIMTSDRIVRCNPFAFRYHLDSAGKFHNSHGRLIDPLHPIISARKPKKISANGFYIFCSNSWIWKNLCRKTYGWPHGNDYNLSICRGSLFCKKRKLSKYRLSV